MNTHQKSQIHIIGGNWRSRQLEFLDLPNIRPTPNRVRETLFNWLAPNIEGATCLDLFAGSGVLGFEAISRGATSAKLIDCKQQICLQIEAETQRFGTKKINVKSSLAEQFIAQTKETYTIIFVDPPFHQKLVDTTLAQLAESNCVLSKKTLVYVEYEINRPPKLPPNWQLWRKSQAAKVGYALLIIE